mgnify:CR=1 FL=1
MTIESTITKAQQQADLGRPWRAKEILGSSIRNYGNSRRLLVAYAETLNQLGDKMEAGKYYLLSVDEPDEEKLEIIKIFLRRHDKLTYRQLIGLFPSQLRVTSRQDYPRFLDEYLERIGAPDDLGADRSPLNQAPISRGQDRAVLIGCALFTCLFWLCFSVGLIEIISWLWQS